jgi:hypothetical protein
MEVNNHSYNAIAYNNDIEVESDEEQTQKGGDKKAIRHYTAEERTRAKQAYELHIKLGHPNDQYLMRALENGNYNNCHLTGQDLRNARDLYGRCPACLEAKIRDKPQPTSTSPPANEVGEVLHSDLIPLTTKSAGGNTVILFAVDEKSGYKVGVPLRTKQAKDCSEGYQDIVREFNSYGHRVKHIVIDSEYTLKASLETLKSYGIEYSTTPAGLHEKRAEKAIQHIKDLKEAMLSVYDYELPAELEAESYLAAIRSANMVPTKASQNYTSHQLVTHHKPMIPEFNFGQVGVARKLSRKSGENRGEWVIYLGYNYVSNNHRVYNPITKAVYSRRVFIPYPEPPSAWNLPHRLRAPATKKKLSEQAATTPQLTLNPDPELPRAPAVNNRIQSNDIVAPPRPKLEELESPNAKGDENLGGIGDYYPEVSDTWHDSPLLKSPSHQKGEETIRLTSPTKVINSSPEKVVSHSPPTPVKEPQRETLVPEKVIPEPITSTTNADPQVVPSTLVPQESGGNRPRRAAAMSNWKQGPARLRDNNQVNMLSTHETQCYRMTIRQAETQNGRKEAIQDAIRDEFQNLKKISKAIPKSVISKQQLWSTVLDIHMFLKDKFKSTGEFDKCKARAVMNGKTQKPENVGETAAPTAIPLSVMFGINFTAQNPTYSLSSYDVPAAFPSVPIPKGKRLIGKIRKDLANRWIKLYPGDKKYLTETGDLYLEFDHYLYGMQDAPHAFNEFLDLKLKSIGMIPNPADPCFYHKHTSDGILMLAVHVDDILAITPSKRQRLILEKELKRLFDVNVAQEKVISYLGMTIKTNPDKSIKVSQEGYITKILTEYGYLNLKKPPSTPATANLQVHDEESPKADKTKYLSLVMALMYLARFTRPDILHTVSYLASRSSNPTQEDYQKLIRVVKYLSGTKDIGLVFSKTKSGKFIPEIWCDASHAGHPDGHGHAGIIIGFGSAPIGTRSFKIKFICRSSGESELYVLEEASTYAIWLKCFLNSMGIVLDTPITIHQDNKSTIIMASQGGNFKRTKHLICKESYVKERLLNGDIKLQYLPTDEMPADMLTKPMSKLQLHKHMNKLFIR